MRMLFGVAVFTLAMLDGTAGAADWSRFRGPNGSGVAVGSDPLPAEIGPEENLLWKAILPPGRSSPVVVSGRIFLTGIRDGNQPVTLCFDQTSGDLIWERPSPQRESMTLGHGGGFAQATCTANDEYVLSFFGCSGLLCYDREGELVWQREFGELNTQYGVASSPVLVDDRVILNQDLDTGSFLIAMRLSDGETIWEVARPSFIANFVTPVIWDQAGQRQVVVPGSLKVIGYDFETGKEVWQVDGVSWSVVSTPIFDEDGTLYVNAKAPGEIDGAIPLPPLDQALKESDHDDSGTFNRAEFENFGPRAGFFPTLDRNKDSEISPEEYGYVDNLWSQSADVLMAIQPGGTGDITESHVLWTFDRSLPFCPSPVYHAGHIYTVKDLGVVNCLVAATGKRESRERRISSRQEYYSSPVVGDDKIYVASERGNVSVISAEPKWEEVHFVKFDEDIYATPAIVDGRIFLRTTETLYCFGFANLDDARVERAEALADSGSSLTPLIIGICLAGGLGLVGLVFWRR
jgi:outer membrane protein assembly factor BamB